MPQPGRRNPTAAQELAHHVDQRGLRVGVQEVDRGLVPGEDRPGQVAERGHDRRGVTADDVPDRDRGGVRGGGIGGVDLGAGPGAPALVADHGDQPGVGEAPEHFRDGRRGERGELAQIGPGEPARIDEQGERRTLVHGAEQLGRAGQTRHHGSIIRQTD
jgi:hypothetical protein